MPSFTYTPDIPAGNQTPAAQRLALQTNTNSISSWTEVDHYGFGTSANVDGYHAKSTYVDQVSDPAAITGADIVYGKTVSGLIELFMLRPTESAIQLSKGSTLSNTSGSGGSVNYSAGWQSFLPGGLLIKGGVVAQTGAFNTAPLPFTTAGLTNFNTIYMALAVPAGPSVRPITVSGLTATQLTFIWESASALTFYWIAVGV